MTTTITKNFISNDNKLFKARVKKIHQWVNGVAEEVEFEQIKKDGKWINLEERGKYIKTKTLYCTKVNHKSGVKKDFKEGKRYQVNMHSGLGQSAGYIYDEDGNAWQLYRSEYVGFYTLCETYHFEAQYK
ncbi:TPA: hypothetical protein R8H58_004464 [Escherichia coli]|nr:hypothetical protein [Escherichia coli]